MVLAHFDIKIVLVSQNEWENYFLKEFWVRLEECVPSKLLEFAYKMI